MTPLIFATIYTTAAVFTALFLIYEYSKILVEIKFRRIMVIVGVVFLWPVYWLLVSIVWLDDKIRARK